MTTVLATVIGPYGLAIEAARVRELLPATEAAAEEGGRARRLWRGQALQLIDLRSLFGCPLVAPAVEVVVGDDHASATLALVVDRVLGLHTLGGQEWCPIPHVGAIEALCDSVSAEPIGERLLFRLRATPDFSAVGV
ncbi:MAG: chemotaxis protein CheW [Alphaproteobacteria bacterium]|nr:chemotaxis protein CheW [Alphaproteobacteria bacterium]